MAPTGIRDFSVSIPEGFYPMLLDEEVTSEDWARDVVRRASDELGGSDPDGTLEGELADLRLRLLAQLNPYLSAAVYLRPQGFLSVGAVMTLQLAAIEPHHDAAWFLTEARELAADPDSEGHTLLFDGWRHEIAGGPLAGVHQVVEYLDDPDAGSEGWVEARTVFGVFPPGADEMVHVTFTTADLAAFGDMPAETESIVATLRVELEA
ncbi:hypothetical protein [Leifsonia sp. AG29]|uniref:hypothetical protein n=1 Tax=Leifsonia sp. AG29 TaxID=2598860 RepID=UPI00131A66E2|nr:hypothetical protein [Leifsonia sp. AG29]